MPTTATLPDDPATLAEFDLDITLLELTDVASLINSTDDNCGSTCGACTTNCA
jgi:FxLD family lantipeptide